jgi:hypothetical protein
LEFPFQRVLTIPEMRRDIEDVEWQYGSFERRGHDVLSLANGSITAASEFASSRFRMPKLIRGQPV